jgi:acetyltransferase
VLEAVAANCPNARLNGVVIEPMVSRPSARAFKLTIHTDPMFGPVIRLGPADMPLDGGDGNGLALPPLNAFLAAELIERSRAGVWSEAAGAWSATHSEALQEVLLRVSEMACELPALKTLNIDPLLVDAAGALALDAAVDVEFVASEGDPYKHMAIHPYPVHLIRKLQLSDGTDLTIRPIRPEDAEMEQTFVRTLSDTSRYFRFMDALRELPKPLLVRFTQIDYDREMALVAVLDPDTNSRQIGVTRYVINPDGSSAEFAVAVADDWQGKGIGSRLVSALLEVARRQGLKSLEGEVLSTNQKMLKLMSSLGFSVATSKDSPTIKDVVKLL